MFVKASELRVKDVINVTDGKRLGPLVDVEIDPKTGQIQSIVVPGTGGRVFGIFGAGNDIVIPWDNIVKIGPDCILVKVPSMAISRSISGQSEKWDG